MYATMNKLASADARLPHGENLLTGALTLSIVIPAYNEGSRLPRTFPSIMRYLEALSFSYEVIVVDDGSTDGTGRIVLEMAAADPRVTLITHEANQGKGKAVQTGMLAARGDYIIFTDADLSTPIEMVESFVAHMANGCDIVVGNRRMKESRLEIRQTRLREFLGRVFTRLTRLVLGSEVSDQTCGFKGFTRRAAAEVFRRQRIADWAFDAEILHIASRLGLKIRQQPVVWRDDAKSKVRVGRACVKSLTSLVAIWYNGVTGKYR
jgi:dolichyl-phosphate beta-glucosyltransferase